VNKKVDQTKKTHTLNPEMIKTFLVTATSLVSLAQPPVFQEEVFELTPGENILKAPHEWSAVSLFSEDRSALESIEYKKNNQWHHWHNFETEDEIADDNLELLIFEENKTQIEILAEKNQRIIAHFFNTEQPGEKFASMVARFDPFDDDSYDNPVTGLPYAINAPEFVSRSDWGADESLRNWSLGHSIKRIFSQDIPEAKRAPKYLQPTLITEFNTDGSRLSFPVQESPQIKKIILHHTGEYIDEKRDPKELMRAIYYFHTVTRGWGDIGYNYVIDKQGNIYEGRFGGPKSIGTHTAYHNLGSIGISLMGNFQTEHPTSEQIRVLELLLADHVIRFNVNPAGSGTFLEKTSFNIAGHKHVAERGHGTSCPGTNFEALLPEIRKKVFYLAQEIRKDRSAKGRDFLAKSSIAPSFKRSAPEETNKEAPVSLAQLIPPKILQRGDKKYLQISLKNGTQTTWGRGTKVSINNIPQGLKITPFSSIEQIAPQQSGIFQARLYVESTPNGQYQLELTPQVRYEDQSEKITFRYPLQISGNQNLLTQKNPISTVQKLSSQLSANSLKKTESPSIIPDDPELGPSIKVKLAFFDEKYANVIGDQPVQIFSQDKRIAVIPEGREIKIIATNDLGKFYVSSQDKKWTLYNPQLHTAGVLKITNYNRGLGSIAYNQFRYQLNFHGEGDREFFVVNQLPLEHYLWGLAEEPVTEPDEKKHAIHILARSYAYVYSGTKRKFKTPAYDLEDDPASSQFYLGYDWERYHSQQKKLIADTRGQVLTYKNQAVIGPYFTQSGGESSDQWRSQYPWTKKQKLPFDEGLEPRGHGVGLSGNTARELAKQGRNYEEIIRYFFDGVQIKKQY
jgi:hypothetical protein